MAATAARNAAGNRPGRTRSSLVSSKLEVDELDDMEGPEDDRQVEEQQIEGRADRPGPIQGRQRVASAERAQLHAPQGPEVEAQSGKHAEGGTRVGPALGQRPRELDNLVHGLGAE